LVSGTVLALPGCAGWGTCTTQACEDDARLAAQVRRQLDRYPALRGPDISVTAEGSVVYLHGLVDTGLERSMAESVAAAVPGVTRVANMLGVNNPR
jgi:osmotically-inducible protein OsmY